MYSVAFLVSVGSTSAASNPGAAGPFRKSDVEEFVVTLEGRVIVPAGRLVLQFQKVANSLSALRVER